MSIFRNNIQTIQEIYLKRKIYFRLIKIHYSNIYSGSRLGFLWLFLGPLILLFLYSITYSLVYRIVLPDYSVLQYITSVYAGLMILLTFMNLLSSCTNGLRQSYRLKQFGLENKSIPIKIALTEIIPFSIGMLILSILSIFTCRSVIQIIFMPIFLFLFSFFAIGVARIMSIFGALFKDFLYIIPYLGIILLLLTPISYIPTMIPSGLRIMFMINPIYYFCIFLQSLSVEGKIEIGILFPIVLISLFLPYLGDKFFKRTFPLIQDSLSQ
tara:strand:- start:243 stop:1049 length:807 start_codon:yes stop_codon:yes gene_type:complete